MNDLIQKEKEERKQRMASYINSMIQMYFNVHLVTCGRCATIFKVEKKKLKNKTYTCPRCNTKSDPCDFPDLFF